MVSLFEILPSITFLSHVRVGQHHQNCSAVKTLVFFYLSTSPVFQVRQWNIEVVSEIERRRRMADGLRVAKSSRIVSFNPYDFSLSPQFLIFVHTCR